MLLEDCDASNRPVAVQEPHFKIFPEFRGTSYAQRYELLLQKLVRDQLYDAATLLLSSKESITTGNYHEPNAELSFTNLASTLVGRAIAAKTQ